MQKFLMERLPLSDLLRKLTGDLKAFVREELLLVRREVMEKVSCYSRHATMVGAGGFIAYAGAIVFLGAIGVLIGFSFEGLGLNPLLATFIGLGITGMLVAAIGTAMAIQGKKELSEISLAPKKTMQTIPGYSGLMEKRQETKGQPSSALQQDVFRIKERIDTESQELKQRVTLRRLRQRAVEHIKEHPVIWGTAALGAVALGSAVVWGRKFLRT